MSKGEELLKRIPKNYKEVNYLKYIEIMALASDDIPDEDYDKDDYNTYIQYAMLSILLDVSVTELTQLPATTIISLLTAINFMNTPVNNVVSNLEVKSIDEITYSEYMSYNTLIQNNDKWQNMPEIIKLLIKNKTQEEIDQLSIYDVKGFFLQLKKGLQKSIRCFQIYLAWKLIRLKIREILMKWKIIKAS